MKLKKLDALLVPKADMYSGEEVPEDEERLKSVSYTHLTLPTT